MNKEIKSRTVVILKRYVLLYIAFFIYSGTTICAKMAAKSPIISTEFIVFVFIEILLLAVYALIWQQVLKHFSLVKAMANKGVIIILNLIWSYILFKEKISVNNIIGALIIIIGIWVVSKDD